MKKVLFVPIGEYHRASSRFRVWELIPKLSKEKYKVDIITYISSKKRHKNFIIDMLLRKLYTYFIINFKIFFKLFKVDIIVIQESLLPLWLLAIIKIKKIKVIFDFSDPIHLLHKQKNISLLKRISSYVLDSSSFITSIKISNSVIIENSYLESVVKEISSNVKVYVMRGPINIDIFKPIKKERTDFITIGWTGSPATLSYIVPLFPIIDKLSEKFNIKLLLMGLNTSPKYEFKNARVEIVSWSLEKEREIVPTFDLGIFYLNNTQFENARGGGKLFVYLSSGVPFLSSDVGIGKQICKETKAGLICTNLEHWENNITKLIEDTKLRKELSIIARNDAVNNYSHDVYLYQWDKILND